MAVVDDGSRLVRKAVARLEDLSRPQDVLAHRDVAKREPREDAAPNGSAYRVEIDQQPQLVGCERRVRRPALDPAPYANRGRARIPQRVALDDRRDAWRRQDAAADAGEARIRIECGHQRVEPPLVARARALAQEDDRVAAGMAERRFRVSPWLNSSGSIWTTAAPNSRSTSIELSVEPESTATISIVAAASCARSAGRSRRSSASRRSSPG